MITAIAAVLVLFAVTAACGTHARTDKRVIVLGIDGMDYGLARELMAAGRMPNFAKVAQSGSFSPLATTVPPQSPVAWSSFITGEDPGRHGIYDFVHRDPATMLPFLSTTRTAPGRTVKLGKWQIPMTSGRVELLRRGAPFWSALTGQGIDATIMRMPANFPPSGTATRELSGMGTPDLRGNYGTFRSSRPTPPSRRPATRSRASSSAMARCAARCWAPTIRFWSSGKRSRRRLRCMSTSASRSRK